MPTDGKITAFTGATFIDGNGGAPVPDAVVLVEDRTIKAGPRSQINIPQDAQVQDVSGRTIIPGLFDCHDHITLTSLDLQSRLFTHPTVAHFQTAQNLKATLQSGFTTIRDAGGLDVGFRQAVEMGLVEGPRLLVSGSVMQTAGHGDWYLPSGVQMVEPGDEKLVDGVPEVQKEARKQLRKGIDFIKTCTTGGAASPADRPEYTEWSLDELKAMVYEAKARGKEVMAHAEGTQGIKNAIMCGVWSVEHGSMLDDEAVQMMLERGTFLVPTLYIVTNIIERGPELGLLPVALEKAKQIHEIHCKSFSKAAAAGVKIGCGTDCFNTSMHGRNARELELMVQYGMTSMQAIVAATKTASEVCKISDKVGTLTPGKLADLVILNGSPLEDISILLDPAKILCVMKEGKVYKNEI